jgi:hypothetical protein
MSTFKNMEKLIKNFCETKRASVTTSDDMDKKVLNEALAVYEKTKPRKKAEHQPIVWRLIMNKPITKLAAVAAIILIAGLTITFLDKAATPAWAIEDTARVLEEFNGIYISGVVNIPLSKFSGSDDLVIKEGQGMSVETWWQFGKKVELNTGQRKRGR